MQLSSMGVAKPTVLMEPHAGIGPCCLSMGIGRSMGDMVVLAGGKLIGSEIIEEMSGRLSPEYIIAQSPEVYIGTGGRRLAGRGGLVLGVDVNPDEARTSLEQVMQRTGLRHIRAMEKAGEINAEEFGRMNQALQRLEKVWNDSMEHRI